MFKVVDLKTGKTLLNTSENISLGVLVDGVERARVTTNEKTISTYLRDLSKERADIKIIRSVYGLFGEMVT